MALWSDPDIHCLLTAQGISPNRTVLIETWLREISSKKLHVCQQGEEILRVLGALTIVPKRGEGCAFYMEDVLFDPMEEGAVEREIIEIWEAELGRNLMPIGVDSRDDRIVIDDEGCIYSIAQGNMACRHGDDLRTSLRGLLLADRKPILLLS
jgi:hypothetical protein